VSEQISVRCCIAGGGPAGLMLAFLLARAGVEVLVLEKHADFLRDFRGDTIHPSTLEVMHELGLLEKLLALPHQKLFELQAVSKDQTVTIANFRRLPTRCPFIAFLPQWDFLNFLVEQANSYEAFQLRMRTEVTGLLQEHGTVVGLRAFGPDGEVEVRADLVVACDGRRSLVRDSAKLPIHELGAPIDVLWFRLSRRPDDPRQTTGRFDTGRLFITINRAKHWQCGYVIPKGSAELIRSNGLDAFRRGVAELAPFLADRVDEIQSWNDVPLLTVRIDRLLRWYRPGLLCIGDAAHAMSPVGGVGINLAIQDAVAAANLLAGPLREGQLNHKHLHDVQRRRQLPTRVTQRFQILIQQRILSPVLRGQVKPGLPPTLRFITRFPIIPHLTGRLVGLGVRPEHAQPAG
jgi:2-polyprenyl-6-methoxyphenol hydroxylase-like FAD-dependent oxidoreductase